MPQPLIAIGIDVEWPVHHHIGILQGVLTHGRARGWACRLEPGLETSAAVDGLPGDYAGIIARASQPLSDFCRRQGIPAVNVWANSPGCSLPTVQPDYGRIGRAAADFLLARGFRNFAYVGDSRDVTAARILAGVLEPFRQEGLECPAHHIPMPPRQLSEWQQCRQQLSTWIAAMPMPLAIIASAAAVARLVADQIVRDGLLIPDDVAILSCQESELVLEGTEPAISSIKCDFTEVGRSAVTLLADLMAGGKPPAQLVTVPVALSINERLSTDVQPTSDRTIARCLRYIWNHSDHPLAVDDVARAAGLSRRTLERRFAEVLNSSVSTEISRSRLIRARRMLEQSDASIKEIAAASGFNSSQHMAQVFSRLLGISPGDCRAAALTTLAAGRD